MKWWPFGRRNNQAAIEPPAPLPALPPAGRIARSMPIFDRFSNHPGQAGATVQQISAIYQLAELGFPSEQCELFDDFVQRDGHLRSQLEGRILAVAGKEWIVTAGGEKPADRKAAEMLEEAIRLVPNWLETVIHLLKGVWYGYSLSETIWEVRDTFAVPVWFSNVPHVRVVFDNVDQPRLVTEEDMTRGMELPPGKFIYERLHGRIAAASGVMRTAAWLSYFKKLAMRDWIVFSERFGMPYVQGKYDPSATPLDKETLRRAVQEIGKDGTAVFSKACEIVMQMVDKGGKADDVQGALARFCDDEISELVTGSTLTSRSGGPGSFALGTVHADRAFDLAVFDAQRIAHRFEIDVALPFVRYNRMDARPPRLKIHLVRDTDPLKRVQVMQILWQMGVPIAKEQLMQENQLKSARPGDELPPPPPKTPAPTSPSDPPPQPE